MSRSPILSTVAILTAGAAQAGVLTPPPGCTAYLTVQSRACVVSHYWTCEGDPEGAHWELAMDGDGPFNLFFTDAEYRWLVSYDLRQGGETMLVEPEEDAASLSTLLAEGVDSYRFSTIRTGPGTRRLRTEYSGVDRLTGDTVEVDGRVLQETEFSYEFDPGDGMHRVEGNQLVSETWRSFFGGIEVETLPGGETVERDFSPMEFAEPGERGFLSDQPLYDCGDMMS
ncbi:MAG: hypothetical protein CL945_03045 [Dinoroseobacter sp.]|nr:hypothetical protein [Dinoroseobacter sp.]MAX73681.1 hypothetical protein [Nioella sp.]